jgi:hypothetical protein
MATYISNQTGLWSLSTTWLTAAAGTLSPTGSAGFSPQSFGGDKIVIRGGHTVTYDVSGCFGDETSTYGSGTGTTGTGLNTISANGIVLSGGTLKASRTINVELTARGNFIIAPSGTLDWGTTTDPLTTTANITLHYMSQLSALSASPLAAGMNLYGIDSANVTNFYNNIWINGKPKIRNTTLAVSAANGATTLTLASPISTLKWEVGDKLIVQSESLSAGLAYNLTGTYLSATNIVSFPEGLSGNRVLVSVGLNTARSAGISVGNFTSNVTVRSYNPLYPAYGIYVHGNNAFSVDINYIKLEPMSNGLGSLTLAAGWYYPMRADGTKVSTGTQNAQQGAMFAMNASYCVTTPTCQPLNMKGICAEYINPFTGSTIGNSYFVTYACFVNGRWADIHTFDDWAMFFSSINDTNGFQFNTVASANVKNCVIYRSTHAITLNSSFPNIVTFDNCRFDVHKSLSTGVYGLQSTWTNCTFRSYVTNGSMAILDTIQSLNIKNCTFVGNLSTGAWWQPSVNSVTNVIMSNCLYYYNTTPIFGITKNANALGYQSSQQAKIEIYQPNNSTYDYRRFNYFHYSQTDLTTRKRGITTYRIKPEISNTAFYNYFTIPATTGNVYRIKGSLRFDSNYGTTYPPSISFVGAGVNTIFTCSSTVNTWQDFDVSLSASSTDDINLIITCQSILTTGYVWLDGLPIYPFIQNVRHYGFIFDNNIYRTIDLHNTLSESSVSALSTISSLDYLYDSATYWSVTNPASSSYIDLVTIDGSTLDFDGHNIIFDSNASTTIAYTSANNTVIIKTSALSAGVNFDTVMTTGSATFLNNPNIGADVKIRTSNYDSEITYGGVDYVILYKSQSDADNSINAGLSSTNGIIRFKYGTTTQGVPMSGTVYAKWYSTSTSSSGINSQTLNIGTNALGDLVGYGLVVSNFKIINDGIKKSSILVPHTTNINTGVNLTTDIQNLINDQQIINSGVQKSSLLIPHTTSI